MNNPNVHDVRITEEKLLSDNWYVLRRYSFDRCLRDGTWVSQTREVYDRGNGAAILLYNSEHQVVLTRQFRLPTYVNGNATGMMIEVCAGLLDDEHPDTAIRRETEEETGFRITNLEKVLEAYMSPGSVTERLHFYLAKYDEHTTQGLGGGIDEEDIEVLKLPFNQAMDMIKSGEIVDAKTIMLLYHLQIQMLQGLI